MLKVENTDVWESERARQSEHFAIRTTILSGSPRHSVTIVSFSVPSFYWDVIQKSKTWGKFEAALKRFHERYYNFDEDQSTECQSMHTLIE